MFKKSLFKWLYVSCLWTLLLSVKIIFGQTFNIQGNIATEDLTPVRYAFITFVDQSDTTQKFSAITDTFGSYRLSITTAIDHHNLILLTAFKLAQNYPNPFSFSTTIPYKLKTPSNTDVTIYDLLGREVKKVTIGAQPAGEHYVSWDGKNDLGEIVAAGIYFYRLQAGGETRVKKMIYSGTLATIGINNPEGVFSPKKNESRKTESLQEFTEKSTLIEDSYVVIIRNTELTNPKIRSREIRDVVIRNDSTLNFTVKAEISKSYFPLQIGNEWSFQFPFWTPSSGDTFVTIDYKIDKKKEVHGKEYYGFNYGMPFFPNNLIVEDLDTVFVRQNEKGDITLLVDDSEWLYFTFNTVLLDSLVRTNIRDVPYFFKIESSEDTVNTQVGSFANCYRILSYFPATKGTEYFIWFASDFGPVKIYYPAFDVTYRLVKINIQNGRRVR